MLFLACNTSLCSTVPTTSVPTKPNLCTTEEDRSTQLFQSTIDKAAGLKRVSKCPEQAREFKFFGFQRNHVGTEVLETKNIVKRAENCKKHLNFRCFLFLGALKQHGRARNVKNQLEGISPDILVPFSAQ